MRESSTPAARESRLHPMPALDGLRALAVSAVFLYHAGLSWATGGFLGVDVFFVISGYLITSLLLADWRRMQRIEIGRFYWRRARRLLPALLALLVVAVILVPLLAPDQGQRLRGDLRAALAYVSNWRLIFENQSYFEAMGRPPLLQHLWSLAVEEQFYLLWPLVLAMALKLRKPRRLVPWILAAAGASAVWMAVLYDPVGDPSRVYYGTDTRLAPILIGAALACVWLPPSRSKRVRRQGRAVLEVAGLLSLGGLLWCINGFNEFDTGLYRGGFAGVAVLAAVVVAVAARPGGSLTASVLAARPLVWLGRRSYSVYLWYWPVLMLTRPYSDVPLTGLPLLALRVAITLALATASYRWVEVPVREGLLGRVWADARLAVRLRAWPRWANPQTAVVVVAAVAALVAGTLIGRSGPQAPALASPVSPASEPISQAVSEVPAVTEPTTTSSTTTTVAATTTVVPTTTIPDALAAAAPAEAPPPPAPVAAPTAVAAAPDAGVHVVAIGDSVLAAAAPSLQQRLPAARIDASIGRQFPEVLDVARRLRDAGQLSERMVVHVGNNGPVRAGQFDALMDLLREVDRVAVVNVKVARPWERVNNEMFRDATQRWTNMVLVDWHAAASEDPGGMFQNDGTHLRPKGVNRYVELILSAL